MVLHPPRAIFVVCEEERFEVLSILSYFLPQYQSMIPEHG